MILFNSLIYIFLYVLIIFSLKSTSNVLIISTSQLQFQWLIKEDKEDGDDEDISATDQEVRTSLARCEHIYTTVHANLDSELTSFAFSSMTVV